MIDDDFPSIPSYKPLVSRKKRFPGKETTYPYKDGNFIFIGADGEWELYIKAGTHPNIVVADDLCKDNLPNAVADLYHPVIQLRLALGIDVSKYIQLAEARWSWFWYTRDLP